ncbi:hypothetical protein M6D93_12820 [Jatrophihabitans telluris]|uniref:Uncharacterized protein n=1 Tax=Jatrophihabitans telluris TaxID=2038343 RepID=A0ABY4QWJ6_9ACTN|nr:hypothetical protein [Jatrophihabitans telluris]UQX87181.1 hypothetical protein M6D93_12820 [Jatrophihabitans telluris]
MQLAILLVLVVALGFLVLGLIGGSTPLVVASVVASAVAIIAVVRARRARAEAPVGADAPARSHAAGAADLPAASESVAATVATTIGGGKHSAARLGTARQIAEAAPAAAAGVVETAPAAPAGVADVAVVSPATVPAAAAEAPEPEPAMADTEAPLRRHGDDLVWVLDGRPRYHVRSCGFLNGRPVESIPLSQAVEDGFTPCALCDPDTSVARTS